MDNGRVMNRGLVVVGAILIQLCLGAIYAWSVFTPPLKASTAGGVANFYAPAPPVDESGAIEIDKIVPSSQLELDKDKTVALVQELQPLRSQLKSLKGQIATEKDETKKSGLEAEQAEVTSTINDVVSKYVSAERIKALSYSFTNTQTQMIFAAGLAAFAVAMIIAGRVMPKVGPRCLAVTGGLIFGLAYVLAGLIGGNSFPMQLIFIGFAGGIGIGLAYVVPIAVGIKWFPDKKGMITGLAVAGFGFGALIWIKLAGAWGNLIRDFGVANVFIYYGIAFFVLICLGATWMKNPPEGWLPQGWTPDAAAGGGTGTSVQMVPAQVIRTPQFYILWFMFIFGAMAGLMTIGIIKLFGIDALQAKSGMSFAEASATAGTAMAVFYAISNGLGRIIWGSVSDLIGRKMSLTIMMGLQGCVMLGFYWMGGTPALLYVGAALIGFNFGGNFALFPAVTADFFGNKNVGLNYGWIFTAYGLGGIVGPIMGGYFKDAGIEKGVEAWLPAFVICGIACLVAAVLGATLKAPKAPAAEAAS